MDLIEKTREFVAIFLEGEPSSHDMSHINRVEALCLKIQKEEGGDPFVLQLAALLHDVGVIKEHEEGGDHAIYSADIASEFLSKSGLGKEVIEAVTGCIRVHRFSAGESPETLEARILQDADRLDALGAVGIFRAVLSMGALRMLKHTTGMDKGSSKRTVYIEDPIEGFNEYMQYKPFTIPEKLNTDAAKKIAEERLKLMHLYLEALNLEAGIDEQGL
ncbi:HD domain-containing protein [Methanosarcina sp.]|uniref:HD domain-containing protein n=1 Tax=Methanosarcina sp. TaxID=2213 RepID=UPI0029882527|nr:HD domain-containing protein [Methanosarcina sp.]MDW5551906.1 HD domain-containing protein [Methanosarcina sp.]MDW5554930.1 HD domain-containing protein [Methanosarcina sp.]MDW5559853.1 HD domain-containing protein [Methanosarcina sp.]